MLNLVLVRSFLTLVRTKSFQAAAEELRIAQPTVSQHIQKLEEQLGARLFHRARAGCEPTEQALAFLPHAESLLRLNDRALAAVKGERLRVGASSNIGIYLLQPYVKTFLDHRVPTGFELEIDRNPVIADRLETGELDVALLEWWDDRPGFNALRWRSEPVVLIVPPGHPLAATPALRREQLAGVELLGGEPGTGTGRLLKAYFGDRVALPRVSLQLGSTEAVKQAVKAGVGVSLVLQAAVAAEAAAGSLRTVRLDEPPLRKELFVVRRHGAKHRLAETFTRLLFELAEGADRHLASADAVTADA